MSNESAVSDSSPSRATRSDVPTRNGAPRSNPGGPASAGVSKAGDKIFLGLSTGSAWLIMVMLAGVAIFLIIKAWPAISANWTDSTQLQDRTSGNTAGWSSFGEYVGPLVFGTLWSALIALVLGAPVAIGIALFISHYAPRRLAGVLGYLIDLLAAVPSIVFGLWGVFVIRDFFKPLNVFLNDTLGWIPLFAGSGDKDVISATGSTILAGGVVLAVMILPIITSISREIFLQTPSLHEEAALALGATRWEMIRLAVLPYGRSGLVSATLLGLGRALGETMAIAIIVSPHLVYSFKLITDGENPATIAGNIALQFSGSNGLQQSALIASGLMLFVISFAVNFVARWIISRTQAGTRRRTKKVKTA